MSTIQEGLRALSAVQAVWPGAILAGGYLRDGLLNRAQKDIDIFVPFSYYFPATLKHVLNAKSMMGAAEYMEQTEVDGIWDIKGFNLPVQVIMLAQGLSPVDRAKAHDFGICQVWHDGESLHTTPDFLEDVQAGTFTLCVCEDKKEYDRSMRRWERLSGKFPDFTLHVPYELSSQHGGAV